MDEGAFSRMSRPKQETPAERERRLAGYTGDLKIIAPPVLQTPPKDPRVIGTGKPRGTRPAPSGPTRVHSPLGDLSD